MLSHAQNPFGTFTALGGSNTCGHGLRKSSRDAFQQLIADGLQRRGLAGRLQPSCVPAMGPDYPASCLAYFAPNTTEFATLEFTPNMGEGREISRNAAALTTMAQRLVARGVTVVLVSVVPRPPTCASCIAMFKAGHAAVAAVALATHLPLVTLHYDPDTWSDDLKHLNEKGHRQLATRVLTHFAAAVAGRSGAGGHAATPRASSDVTDGALLPTCVSGADLEPMIT
jgi:lysophospholipase L1-like esterase